MSRIYSWIYFLQLCHLILSTHIGHEIGSTSMDSTHYDRRNFHQQCSLNNQIKEFSRPRFWLAVRSSPSSINNSNSNNLIPFRRQLITNNNNDEDRLVTRTSSNPINKNETIPLDIDQATVDIIVDKQVNEKK